jgi:hypothetical protein
MTFEQFFEAATGHEPYNYQRRLAVGDGGGPRPCQSQVINIPTGPGKTLMVRPQRIPPIAPVEGGLSVKDPITGREKCSCLSAINPRDRRLLVSTAARESEPAPA